MASTGKIVNDNNLFGDRLRDLRGTRKKAEFARFLGVDAPAYQRYEDGMVPRADCLCAIAQRAGVSVEWLIGVNPNDQLHPGQAAPAPPPATLALPPPATSPACRFPKDCDLDQRMSAIEIKLDTLLGLLGAPLRRETKSRIDKAG